jgi:hypothetical protein
MVEHKSEKLPILVGYVQALGAGFANVARVKGAGDDVPIQSLVKWMASMGLNGDLFLRTDPEPSIKNVGQVVTTASSSQGDSGGDAGEQPELKRRS